MKNQFIWDLLKECRSYGYDLDDRFITENELKEETMSCSKWAYTPETCDGDFCVGDCDFCSKATEDEGEEVDEDGVRAVS